MPVVEHYTTDSLDKKSKRVHVKSYKESMGKGVKDIDPLVTDSDLVKKKDMSYYGSRKSTRKNKKTNPDLKRKGESRKEFIKRTLRDQ